MEFQIRIRLLVTLFELNFLAPVVVRLMNNTDNVFVGRRRGEGGGGGGGLLYKPFYGEATPQGPNSYPNKPVLQPFYIPSIANGSPFTYLQ